MNHIDAYGITALWYLAHLENLPSIFRHGILSHREMQQGSIVHKRIDWSSVQRYRVKLIEFAGQRFFLQDKVPLFFACHQPMLYVQPDRASVAHLELDPRLLLLEGTLFTDGNAAVLGHGTGLYNRLEDLCQLDWRVIRTPNCYSKEYKRKKAAEVLATSPVAPSHIRRVHVADKGAQNQVGKLPVPVEVSPLLYSW